MENLKLNAEIRKSDEKLSEIRGSKRIPGVVYGNNQEPIQLNLDYSEFLKTFRKAGESHIINLKAGKDEIEVLVHEVQKAPVSGDFIHIDFYAITRGVALTAKIHLNFTGTAPALKEGALLEEHIKELEVKCLPRDLIDSFEVDLSKLEKFGDSIRVSDLNIDSEKYEVTANPEDMIAMASEPAKAEVLEDIAPVTPVGEGEGEEGEAEGEENTEEK